MRKTYFVQLCALLSFEVIVQIALNNDSIDTSSTIPDMSWDDSLQSAQVKQVPVSSIDSIACFDLAGNRMGKDAKGVVVKNNKVIVIK